MSEGKSIPPAVAIGVIAGVLVLCAIGGFVVLGGGGPERHPQPGPAKIPPQPVAQAPPAWVLEKLKGAK